MRNAGIAMGVGVLVLTGLALSGSASAGPGKGRVGVRISGTQETAVRAALVQLLEQHDYSVVSAEQLEQTATKLHRGLDTQPDLQAVAAKLKLVGVVAGEVMNNGSRAGVVVRSGSTGRMTAKATWAVAGGPRKLAEAVKGSAWARLGPGLAAARSGAGRRDTSEADRRAEELVASVLRDEGEKDEKAEKAAPPEPSPVSKGRSDADLEREAGISASAAAKHPPAEAKEKSDADLEREAGVASGPAKSDRSRSSAHRKDADDDDGVVVARSAPRAARGEPGLTALELGAGPRLLWRSLRFGAGAGTALVPFSMAGTPTFGAAGSWYPGAHVTTGAAANIGITGSVEYASAINSRASDGATFPTATSDLFGGLRLRLPIGGAALTATGGYGRHAFVFHSGTNTDRANVNVPDTDNKYLRAAGDLFVPVGAGVSFTLGAGYRYVMSPGSAQYQVASADYFPDATVRGYDATIGMGYRFLSLMEARVGYDLRRYTTTTHAQAGAIPVASFNDQYSALWFSLGLTVDGPPRQQAKHKKARKGSPDDDDDDEG